MSVGTGVLF